MANRKAVVSSADLARAAKAATAHGCAVRLKVLAGEVVEVLVHPAPAPIAAEGEPKPNAWDD